MSQRQGGLDDKKLKGVVDALAKGDWSSAAGGMVGLAVTLATNPVAGVAAAGATKWAIAWAAARGATARLQAERARLEAGDGHAREELILRCLNQSLHEARQRVDASTMEEVMVQEIAGTLEEGLGQVLRSVMEVRAEVAHVRAGVEEIRERFPKPAADADLLASYRKSVCVAHNRPAGLFVEHVRDLDTVFVELAIGTEGGDLGGDLSRDYGHRSGLTLHELMELGTADAAAREAPRWVVLGDPGAGKSTLARHLAFQLATEQGGPVPVYAPLPALAIAESHPFDWAERSLKSGRGQAAGAGLRHVLNRLAEEPGRLWLFLDGLDEVAPEQLPWVRERLVDWAASLPEVTIAVFSRPVGFRSLGAAYRARARIEALSDPKQRELLQRWLGPEVAEDVLAWLHNSPGLRDACRVPLLLSLLAFVVKTDSQAPALPRNKRELFERSLSTLLERGHSQHVEGPTRRRGEHRTGVRNPDHARDILGRLCYVLQRGQGEAWPRRELDDVLLRLCEEEEQEENKHVTLRLRSWDDTTAFLEDVAHSSGVLAAHDGPDAPWRFLHRQFRELLAAEGLRAKGGDGEVLEQAKGLAEDEVPRWAEVLGFACELSVDPPRVLHALGQANEELALRVLPELEGMDCVEALGVLRANDEWDGDFLVALLDRWIDQGGLAKDSALGWLRGQVTPQRSTEELAYFHYALEHLGEEVGREDFFGLCNRWPAGGPPPLELVAIPGGRFMMGSPADEEGRFDDEGPQHEVMVSAFALGKTAVTREQYRLFEDESPGGDKASQGEALHLPVVDVSWWSAYLYCRWLGGRLPTEAEWEYACRAGTTSARYGVLDNIAWYDENSEDQVHPVGGKGPNKFGLYDMLGNVWEWCSDWYVEEYDSMSQRELTGPAEGRSRVVRGGSYFDGAGYCRSACRFARSPGYRSSVLGFRLAAGQEPGK